MKSLHERYLKADIKSLCLDRKKMAFIIGPRQVGKTTLSRQLLEEADQGHYRNWDEINFRRLWTKSPNEIKELFDLTMPDEVRLVVLDEIHKSKGWKQKIKGLYDELGDKILFIVTGSARLDIYKKGGDSLMGRYFSFRLHPLSLGELLRSNPPVSPEIWRDQLFEKPTNDLKADQILTDLLKFSGFPEPYFSKSEKILNLWQRGRLEKLIREDLRDLSRIIELSQVEMLASLLPTKIGSPLSVQSLREDLETSHGTVTRWLSYLKSLFYFYEIKPYVKSISRSLKKEGKIYLYDWTEVSEPGIRFENLIASHLLKSCHFWTDTGLGLFELHYLRNKEKQEIDFLITKNKKPWLCVEAKLSNTKIDTKTLAKLCHPLAVPYVQVVATPKVWSVESKNKLVISASAFLKNLP